MVELLEEADVTKLASARDPYWEYFYDAAGNVVEERMSNGDPRLMPMLSPITLQVSYCFTYDAQRRLSRVEELSRSGSPGTAGWRLAPPCQDALRAPVADFRYDELGRRVYSKMLGTESFSAYGPGGELLEEVNSAGAVLRSYVYLDGEPFVLAVGGVPATLRPGGEGGCGGCARAGGALGLAVLATLGLALFFFRRGNRRLAVRLLGLSLFLAACTVVRERPDGGTDTRGPKPMEDPVYYFHNDRLGTPQRMTGEDGGLAWRAEYRPFGDLESIDTDPRNTGTHVENNLRFPGQYDDALLSLILSPGPYFNWHRWLEPGTGRYWQGEPVLQRPKWVARQAKRGFSASAYGYARDNPIGWFDATGLDVQNNSNDGVWIVGEHGERYYLAPGDTYYGEQDGFYSGTAGVYETNEGVDAVINPDGTVSTFGGPPASQASQAAGESGAPFPNRIGDRLGGPKDDGFLNRHTDWPTNPAANYPGGSTPPYCGR